MDHSGFRHPTRDRDRVVAAAGGPLQGGRGRPRGMLAKGELYPAHFRTDDLDANLREGRRACPASKCSRSLSASLGASATPPYAIRPGIGFASSRPRNRKAEIDRPNEDDGVGVSGVIPAIRPGSLPAEPESGRATRAASRRSARVERACGPPRRRWARRRGRVRAGCAPRRSPPGAGSTSPRERHHIAVLVRLTVTSHEPPSVARLRRAALAPTAPR